MSGYGANHVGESAVREWVPGLSPDQVDMIQFGLV